MQTLTPDDPIDWSSPVLDRYAAAGLLQRGVGLDALAAGRFAGMVYLATPYSLRAVDERGRWSLGHSVDAMAEAAIWAGRCARAGISAFAPVLVSAQIVHDDYAAERRPEGAIDPLDADRWAAWCAPFLYAARAVIVPPMAGWDESRGIWREVVVTLRRHRPVYLIGEAVNG